MRSISMVQYLLFQSCIKSILCGIENRVIKESVKCSNFCEVVIDMPFCFLLEKSHRRGTSGYLHRCFMPCSIQHNLLPLALGILDKYRTVELSQLEIHRFLWFAVYSSFQTNLSYLFQGHTFKKVFVFICLCRIVSVILKTSLK